MKQLTLITLCFIVIGIARSAHAADLRQIDKDIIMAAAVGDDETIKPLLAKGANIDARGELGNTPLIMALYNDHPSIANTLLDHNANVNLPIEYPRETALLIATKMRYTDIVVRLLAKGADADARSSLSDMTPLDVAKFRGNHAIVDYLTKEVPRRSVRYALLAADELASACNPKRDPEIPAFPPELIHRVLQPLIKASLEEDQQ